MLQRVGVAQALINDPELVVLDEPMSGLDPIGRKEVRDLILRLKESGKTVLFSSHILHDAEVLCDRVAMILKGRLVACGRVTDLLDQGASHQVELVVDRLTPEGSGSLTSAYRQSRDARDLMLVVLKSQQQVGERWRLSARRRRDWCRSILRRGRWRTSSSGRSKDIGVHRRVAHENPIDRAEYLSRKLARQAALQSAGLCPAHDRQFRAPVAVNLGEFHRLILDLGLGSINFFGVLIAIFVGIGLVSKEIEKKTIYTIVSKPVARYQFLLGKYLGLTITLFVNTVVMALGLLVVLYAQAVPVEGMLFKALALIFVEFMVITAVALLFSTFTSATLSAIFTLAMYVIGHLTADLKTFGAKMDDLSRGILDGIYYLLPNLERFNLKGHVVHHLEVSGSDLMLIVAYGATYTAVLLFTASLIFHRRDFR